MEKDKLHEDLKQLSGYIYKDNKNIEFPENWTNIAIRENKKTGLYTEAFLNNDNIVIVYRGTDMEKSKYDMMTDLINDIQLPLLTPTQYKEAKIFYNSIKTAFPDKKITLTGHSLGGNIAQKIGAETGVNTVTFNAFGAGKLNDNRKVFDNIINYGNPKDPIFMLNLENQLGTTMLINDFEKKQANFYKINKLGFDYDINKHLIENMGELSNAIEYKGINFQEPQDYKFKQKSNINEDKKPILKAKIEENVDYKDVDNKRVFTLEEIKNMPQDEFLKNRRQILEDFTSKKIISQSEADERINTGDLIWVNSYTRDDGTEVKGYYRSR